MRIGRQSLTLVISIACAGAIASAQLPIGPPRQFGAGVTGAFEGWFENDTLSTRLIYSYRSDFLTGIVSALPQYVAGAGDWSASINYKLTRQLTLSLDAKNITGELARQYVVRRDMPAAIYNNGRQFYLGLKFAL